jgi:superfamily II DNA or RNA helicase
MASIKSRISNIQFKMNYFEEQLVIAEDANFRRNHDQSEAFRIWYNQYIQEFFSKNVIAFQREIIEIKGKINLLPGEEKSTLIYNTEIETLYKMNENFKKRVDALIIKKNE